MTQQEFVKKESKRIYTEDEWSVSKLDDSHSNICEIEKDFISIGLTKGLEIAKEFTEWSTSSGYMKSYNGYGATLWIHVNSNSSAFTTDELLTIFLNEKYGNNG